ncbi:hypothetical protein HDV06_005270 [Boothiomyces sp. JEL0866]|nr:hypothetical protein HDV06_005270 [Boothiomyces sp. JEL0866]
MDGDGPLERVTLERNRSSHATQAKQAWIPQNRWAKLALLISFVQFVIVSAIELYIMIGFRGFLDDLFGNYSSILAKPNSTIPSVQMEYNFNSTVHQDYMSGAAITVYHGLLIGAQLFQLILIADALFQLSLIQLVTTTAFNWATFGYGIIQTRQAATWASDSFNITTAYPNYVYKLNASLLKQIDGGYPYGGASIALIVVLLLFCIGWVFLTWKLYYVFGWTTYKEMGADVRVKNVLYLYHIYILLLKIDVYFWLGFIVQFVTLVLAYGTDNGVDSNSAIALNVTVSLTGAFAILILAYYAVRKENKYLVYATLAGFMVAIGYALSKIYAIYFKNDERFSSSRNSMTFFIVIMVLLSIATMVVAVFNMLQFGHGYINRDSSKDTLEQEYAI